MKKLNIKIITAILIVFCGVFGIVPESAMAKRAISISPTSQRIILTPGEKFTSGFSIINPNDAKDNLEYVASVGTYSTAKGSDSNDDYGAVDLSSISEMNEVMNWTTIDNPTGVLAPNESKTLSYTINVPKNAPAGGQYMTILVKENPDKVTATESDGSNVKEVMQMAFIVYAEVAGDTKRDASILENNMPSFLLNNKLEATSRVRNSGNVHTDAEYTLQVWPLFSDEEICTNEEDVSSKLVMPNTERYHVETCELPTVGIFRAKQTVKIFGETSVVERTIIVCPLWLLFIILFVIIALIVWIVIRVRMRKRAAEESEAE